MQMSDVYIHFLEQVQKELNAAQDTLSYTEQNWYKNSIFLDIPDSGFSDIIRAGIHLEAVYFIRLFSTFESILKEHLAQHHPGTTVPEEARAVWLIDRTAQRQAPAISAVLKDRVHDIRRYRNHLTHLNSRALFPIPFTTALARLNKFVDYLPEPR
jgi:hypothetical protein